MKQVVLVMFALLLFCSVAYAQVPRKIHFQGYLTDSSTNPQTGTFSIVFRIYDADTGGTPLWEETHGSVNVTNGYYDVTLGTTTALSLAFDAQYYLALEVISDGEMSPRFAMCAVPYAVRAEVAEDSVKLNGQAPSYYNDWNNLSNVPAAFPPESHNHDGVYAPIDDSRFLMAAQKTELTGGGDCTLHTHAGMGTGDITAVTVTAPLTGGGLLGDVSIGIQQANSSQSGYLSSVDWAAFNSKAAGTHTHAAGEVISGIFDIARIPAISVS